MDLLEIHDEKDVVVVSFTQVQLVDETTIRKIGQAFRNLTLEAAADRKLLLNFQKVEFMASSMLGQVIRLHKQCKQDKTQLRLCGISDDIIEVFRLTRLDKLLQIHKTQQEALDAFGAPRRSWFRRD